MSGADVVLERLVGLDPPSVLPSPVDDDPCCRLGRDLGQIESIIGDHDRGIGTAWTSGLMRVEGSMVEVVTSRPRRPTAQLFPWRTDVVVDEEVIATWRYATRAAALHGHNAAAVAAFDLDPATELKLRNVTSAPHRMS